MNFLLKFKKLSGVGIILIVWTLLFIFLGEKLFPPPWEVFAVLARLLSGKKIWLHMLFSLYRIVLGLTAALIIGIPIGLVSGVSSRIDGIISPVTYLLYPLPKIAFLPVFMVIFGLGDLSKIVLLFTVIVFQIIIATRDGVKGIPDRLFKAVKTLGLSRGRIYADLIVPSTMPKIVTALRISLGISISVLFFGENYATTYGIGYFIMNSWIMVHYSEMFAGIVAISLMGIGLFRLIDVVEKRLCPWLYI